MKTIINNSFLLNRKEPENYLPEDERHFAGDLNVTVKETHIRVFKKATVVQHLLFNGFQIAEEYCLSRKILFRKKIKALLKRCAFKKRKIAGAVWVLDQWSFGYFHWLTEVLPRILVAKNNGYSFPIVFPENSIKYLYFSDSLNALGADAEFYQLDASLQIRNCIAPSHLQPAQFDPEQIKQVRNCFRQYDGLEQNTSKSKRIYISRTIAQRRFVRNESELESILSRFGFETIYMEKLSFQEQRILMSETAFLISNHGAGLTNMIFMPDSATVI